MAWHRNDGGHITREPVPHLPPGAYETRDLLGFTEAQHLQGTAIHEAAHALLFHQAGAEVEFVQVRPLSELDDGLPAGETAVDYHLPLGQALTALAAGERAETRWLHETGLWQPTRAWAVERLAKWDRARAGQHVRACMGREMTYGTEPGRMSDYQTAHEAADAALARRWVTVQAAADALVAHRRLTGAELARIAAAAR